MKKGKFLKAILATLLIAGMFQATVFAADVDGSKSAAPTELTPDARQTEVTLSLPSAEYHDEYDIVFVIDTSSSAQNANFSESVRTLLNELLEHEASINVSVIKFRGIAFDAISLASGGSSSGLVEYTADMESVVQAAVDYPKDSFESSGSNVHSGLRMAQDLLAADEETPNDHKYVILLTDGKSYIWNNASDEATTYYSQYYRGNGTNALQGGGAPVVAQNSGYNTGIPAYSFVPEGVERFWTVDYQTIYDSTNEELTGTSKYEFRCYYAYGGSSTAEGSVNVHETTNGAEIFSQGGWRVPLRSWYEFVPSPAWADAGFAWLQANPYMVIDNGDGTYTIDNTTPNPDYYMLHPTSLMKGVYEAGHLWSELNALYNVAAFTHPGSGYPAGVEIAESFAAWLRQNSDYGANVAEGEVPAVFDAISDDIIYMVGSGTVTDVIPEEFTLVENGTDTFRMTLNGEALTAVADGDAAWNFGTPGEDGVYPYRVEYSADENSFKWIINVPVENSRPVTLTYTLEIAEDAEPGEHDTNVSAVLEYMNTKGVPGTYPFPVPVVTYIETFTVTYNDGVDGEEAFPDQVYSRIPGGDPTPAFNGTPTRDGYTFVRWEPEVAETVTADAVYKAVWEPVETETEETTPETTAPETTAPVPQTTPSGNGPSTGDRMNTAVWAAAILLAVLAMMAGWKKIRS